MLGSENEGCATDNVYEETVISVKGQGANISNRENSDFRYNVVRC